jgi:DNA polymerase-3 subunit epsilon
VLDKQIDRYRRGGRTLTDLCRVYRVPLDGAHSADADAIAACRVVWRIGQQQTELAQLAVHEVHERQVEWAREQAEGLAAYFRETPGKESWADGVRTEWPFIPVQRAGGDR